MPSLRQGHRALKDILKSPVPWEDKERVKLEVALSQRIATQLPHVPFMLPLPTE